jgi:cell wall-associated NlpC family hydrolase
MFRSRTATAVVALVLFGWTAGCKSTGTPTPAAFPGAPGPSPDRSSSRPPSFAGPAVPVDPVALIDSALQFRGTPYRWGGDQPADGFDCSGFVHYVFELHQVQLPRTAAEQYDVGRKISLSRLEPGDLIFFTTIAPGASHVGIAISGDEFIHAPGTGDVVRIDRVDAPYWKSRAIGARRRF